jgi:predicted nucleic acid-binding protein
VRDDAPDGEPLRVVPDAMVLASGLTSAREPASFAKRLIEAALDGRVAFILTETLLGETRAVLLLPEFPGHMSEEAAETLIEVLRGSSCEGRGRHCGGIPSAL